uniref:Uncharacterized protein n=1 Tax=viral metagenome TaxID=1070528 RepID=A0A6C0H0N6_9ZZZZ
MHNIVDYLTDYLSIFTRGSYVGGDLSEPVKGFIERVDFKSVLNYYYKDDESKLLELKLKEDKKEEFKKDQVELVTKMLEKVDSYKKLGISGESKISQLGGSKNGYWPILAVAATLVDGSSAPTAKPSSGLPAAAAPVAVATLPAAKPPAPATAPAAAPAATLPAAPPATVAAHIIADPVVAPVVSLPAPSVVSKEESLLSLILKYMRSSDDSIIDATEKLITVAKFTTDANDYTKMEDLDKGIKTSNPPPTFVLVSISDLASHLNKLYSETTDKVLKVNISDIRMAVLTKYVK